MVCQSMKLKCVLKIAVFESTLILLCILLIHLLLWLNQDPLRCSWFWLAFSHRTHDMTTFGLSLSSSRGLSTEMLAATTSHPISSCFCSFGSGSQLLFDHGSSDSCRFTHFPWPVCFSDLFNITETLHKTRNLCFQLETKQKPLFLTFVQAKLSSCMHMLSIKSELQLKLKAL